MKIVHLNADKGIHPTRSKGAAVHLSAMREAFGGLGHEVIAIDQPDQALLAGELESAGAGAPIDLIYERLSLNGSCGSRFAQARGIPHVLEVNAPLDEEESRYRSGSSASPAPVDLSSVLQAAELLLCVSQDCADWARSKGASEARIMVAGNGVDAERFHPRRRAQGLLDTHVSEQDFVIGFHGRLRPWHAFGRLVEACAELLAAGLPVHLVMIGNGDFEAAIGDALPTSRWTHIPWVKHEEVGAYVARFDVLPLSYDPDQPCYFSPLKLLEGMAAGAVAVAPDLGDLAQTVSHGESGLIYDPRAAGALASAIGEVHSDPSKRAALAAGGRACAEQHSWVSIASSVIRSLGGSPV